MKNNTLYTVFAVVVAAIMALIYAVLFRTGTVPAVAPLAQTAVWLSLLVLGTLMVLPLLCKCKKDGLCKTVRHLLPAVIVAAMGNLASTGLLALFTNATGMAYFLAQVIAVFFGVFLMISWGLFLYEIITGALCPDRKHHCDKPIPSDNCGDDFSYSDNKYKY